nr:FAD-dependent oxidoreductase [Propionivibrio sp.]
MRSGKLFLILVLGLAAGLFFIFDLGQYLNLQTLKAQQVSIEAFREARPVFAIALYFSIYVLVTALSLPGATLLTLAGGAIFGLLWGTIIISFASTAGATLAFLISRFLLRDWVKARFGQRLDAIDEGIRREGAFYLFTLRLVPVFPFFLLNLLFGLTGMKARTFYWVSQIGMLAGTVVYVNAGTQLAKIDSLAGIVSPALLGSFVLLGIFPLLARKIVAIGRVNKLFAAWKKPARFDRNLVVIGAGSAGLVTAYIASAIKAKVTLVEKHKMGGDCLNTGCVPSKALIRSAKLLSHMARSREFGIELATAEFDFAAVMERVQSVIRTVEPHDSVARYSELGVDVVEGSAKIVSPWEVDITRNDGSTQRLTTRSIVIAAGARPFVPPIPGIDEVGYLTSDNVWNLRELPRRLVVLGGGPIGSELAQAFARLGAKVTQVEMAPRIMIREDPDVSEMVQRRFAAEGIAVLVNHRAKQFLIESGEKVLIAEY